MQGFHSRAVNRLAGNLHQITGYQKFILDGAYDALPQTLPDIPKEEGEDTSSSTGEREPVIEETTATEMPFANITPPPN